MNTWPAHRENHFLFFAKLRLASAPRLANLKLRSNGGSLSQRERARVRESASPNQPRPSRNTKPCPFLPLQHFFNRS